MAPLRLGTDEIGFPAVDVIQVRFIFDLEDGGLVVVAFGGIESFVEICDNIDDQIIVLFEYTHGAEEGTHFVLASNMFFTMVVFFTVGEFFQGASMA